MSSLSPLSHPTAAPTPGRALAGHWKLPAGRVLSLYPRERSVLEITLGRVWLTGADGPGPGADHVLAAGERLVVEPGRHVVIEPWAGAGWPAAAFRWDASAGPWPWLRVQRGACLPGWRATRWRRVFRRPVVAADNPCVSGWGGPVPEHHRFS